LFSYCCEALELSEHEAYNRIEAARLAQRFPVVLDLLAAGALNSTSVRLLAPHLTHENHRAVLEEVRRKPKREIEELIARLSPRPDAPASLRRLPMPRASQAAHPAVANASEERVETASICSPGPTVTTAIPPQPKRAIVEPLAPERYRLQLTIGKETHAKLRLAQDLLRREIPDGDAGAILDRALTLLLEEVAKRKLAKTATARPARPAAPGSRHIPASVRRAVWVRDGGQCAFVAKDRRRCSERVFLEFHHVRPFALGGGPTVQNISLRCRGHNAYEAELDYGRDVNSFRNEFDIESERASMR
jgi:hypothetical protein